MLGPRKTLALIALCVPVVAACKADITTDVYVRDFQDVLNGREEKLAAPARVTIAFPGTAQQCEQRADKIVEYLRDMFPSASSAGCRDTQSMNVEMGVDVRVPIVREGSDAAPNAGATVLAGENGDLSLRIDDAKLDATLDSMKAENPMISLDSLSAGVTILNDSRDPVDVRVGQAFADGEPIWDETFELRRRDDLEVTLSDVGAALLRDGFAYPIVRFEQD